MQTTVDRSTEARKPALDRTVAMRLAGVESDRVVAQLRSLRTEDWGRPTDCPAWDVRQLAAHMLGMCEMAASLREQIRQMRKAGRAGGIDALTALQVAEREHLAPGQIIERFAVVGPRATRQRKRAPGFIHRRVMPDAQPAGGRPGSPAERWTFGFLLDVILTRDPWMHRTDIAAATGIPMTLTPEHDGVLVADVVQEWAGRHQQPYSLVLTGPAGGPWSSGSGGETIEMDAVKFCRALSGRGGGDGLLAVEVPF